MTVFVSYFFIYDDDDDEIGETSATFSSSGSLFNIFPAKDKQQADHKEPLQDIIHGHFKALVLQLFMLYLMHNLSLETLLLNDEGASLPTSIAIPEKTFADNAISVITHFSVPVRSQTVANDPQVGSNLSVEAILPESLLEHHYPQCDDQSNLDNYGARDVLTIVDHENLALDFLICTVTPASSNMEETHNTLKFASRAKRVKIYLSRNKLEEGQVKIQSRLEEEEDAKDALLSQIQKLTKLIFVSLKNSIPGSRFSSDDDKLNSSVPIDSKNQRDASSETSDFNHERSSSKLNDDISQAGSVIIYSTLAGEIVNGSKLSIGAV
ncbi:hypothetical protein P3S68_001841 [Capsicum galapagoense]